MCMCVCACACVHVFPCFLTCYVRTLLWLYRVLYVSCMHKCAIIFHGPPYRFAHLTQSLLKYSVVNVGSSATATAVLICLAISYTTTAHVELCAAIQSACTEIE